MGTEQPRYFPSWSFGRTTATAQAGNVGRLLFFPSSDESEIVVPNLGWFASLAVSVDSANGTWTAGSLDLQLQLNTTSWAVMGSQVVDFSEQVNNRVVVERQAPEGVFPLRAGDRIRLIYDVSADFVAGFSSVVATITLGIYSSRAL